VTSPLIYGEDLLLYNAYLTRAPFDYSLFTVDELMEHALTHSDIQCIETDAHSLVADDLEPHDVLSVLVIAKAPGLPSKIQEPRLIDVDKGMKFYSASDREEEPTQLYKESHNLRGDRNLHIREGKSPDDKKTPHFLLIFCKFPLFLRPFPELMRELYKTTAFHHAPLQCDSSQTSAN
jgi:hypothetical protein